MEEKEVKKSSKGKRNTKVKASSKAKMTSKKVKKGEIKKITVSGKKRIPNKVETKKVSGEAKDKIKNNGTTEVIKASFRIKETPKETKTPSAKKDISVKVESPQKVDVTDKSSESEKELLEKTIVFDGRQSKNLRDVVNKLEKDKVVVDNKVIKRSKIKKIIIIILVILMVIICLLNVKYIRDNIIEKKESNQTIESNIYKKVSKNYKSIDDIEESNTESIIQEVKYENIKFLSMSDFEKKVMQKEDMIVMIASTTCYSCITFEPIVEEVFGERDEVIYRIDIANFTPEEVERFRTYYAFRVTPTIFVLKDGIVKSDTYGLMSKDELIKWLDENA